MTLAEQVRADVNQAMKTAQRDRAAALRVVLSELQKAAKEGSGDELAVLRRERKRRLEAAQQFRDAGRGEYGTVCTRVIPACSSAARVRSNPASVSVGNPTITSVVTLTCGTARRSAVTSSRYSALE